MKSQKTRPEERYNIIIQGALLDAIRKEVDKLPFGLTNVTRMGRVLIDEALAARSKKAAKKPPVEFDADLTDVGVTPAKPNPFR